MKSSKKYSFHSGCNKFGFILSGSTKSMITIISYRGEDDDDVINIAHSYYHDNICSI